MREKRKMLLFFLLFVAIVISTTAAGMAEHPSPVRMAAFAAVVGICAFLLYIGVKVVDERILVIPRHQITSAYVSLAVLFVLLFLLF